MCRVAGWASPTVFRETEPAYWKCDTRSAGRPRSTLGRSLERRGDPARRMTRALKGWLRRTLPLTLTPLNSLGASLFVDRRVPRRHQNLRRRGCPAGRRPRAARVGRGAGVGSSRQRLPRSATPRRPAGGGPRRPRSVAGGYRGPQGPVDRGNRPRPARSLFAVGSRAKSVPAERGLSHSGFWNPCLTLPRLWGKVGWGQIWTASISDRREVGSHHP